MPYVSACSGRCGVDILTRYFWRSIIFVTFGSEAVVLALALFYEATRVYFVS